MSLCSVIFIDLMLIWKVPVDFDRKLSHHKEHEAKMELILIPFSCPSGEATSLELAVSP